MAPGPLTTDDMRALWHDVTDPGYWRPLEEHPNSGIEAIEQAMQQHERASQAVDATVQACFIFPWSGQSNDPASGAMQAQVVLQVVRAGDATRPIVFSPQLLVVHTTTDYGPEGAQSVTTGRRYAVAQRAVLLPGATALTVHAIAEQAGTGYNLPQPGTIQQILTAGASLTNTTAAVLSGNQLQLAGSSDVLTPAHVLSYIQFTSGPNTGQVRRVVSYQGGSPPVVTLDDEWIFVGALTGAWQDGEVVTQAASGASGKQVGGDARSLVVDSVTGTFVTGQPIVGSVSGATYTPSGIERSGVLATGAASWRTLDWLQDLGIAIANPDFPSGGRLPMLDELGEERAIPRALGESDATYRPRVGTPADVVTPNAIRRTVNHILEQYGLACCFRQVGSPLLRGFFYDGGSSADSPQRPEVNFAYDMPMTALHRFKRYFDLVHFRAYFLVGIPVLPAGDYGFAYDVGPNAARDVKLHSGNFYDGTQLARKQVFAVIRAAVERARMGGVRWDLYIERLGCF